MSASNFDGMSPIPHNNNSAASYSLQSDGNQVKVRLTHDRSVHTTPYVANRHNVSGGSLQLQQEDLMAMQEEIEQLKRRREELERQRQELKYGISKRASSVVPNPQRSHASIHRSRSNHSNSIGGVCYGNDSYQNRSQGSGINRSSSNSVDFFLGPSMRPIDHSTFIPSERERRKVLSQAQNPYREMKERIKMSWESDSTLVGGYFGLKDNPHTGSFSRARRFSTLPGQTCYYLSTDIEKMQRQAVKGDRPHYSVTNRGKSGCNVNSHWNNSKGGSAPGPGAYTPRYQKIAPPSILSRR
eukprot:Tbor_TRINITY_DN5002_c1_g5::TRINITY_DN5002_c1_g5_i1::g.14157::m.14157